MNFQCHILRTILHFLFKLPMFIVLSQRAEVDGYPGEGDGRGKEGGRCKG